MTESELIKTENEALKRMKMCIGISPSENIMSAFKLISEALEEVQQYRTMEQRLKKIYGEFDDLLETAITYLENHNGIHFPGSVGKSRLLTDDDVDRWEAYKAIGTVEEFKALKEKSEPKNVKEIHCDEYYCPACGSENNCSDTHTVGHKFCPECGQALKT